MQELLPLPQNEYPLQDIWLPPSYRHENLLLSVDYMIIILQRAPNGYSFPCDFYFVANMQNICQNNQAGAMIILQDQDVNCAGKRVCDHLNLLFDMLQRRFFKTADLCLRNSNFSSHFCLRASLEESKGQNMLFPFGKPFHCIA